MPRQTATCANSEFSVPDESIRELHFRILWSQLREHLPNIFCYQVDLAKCIEDDDLSELCLMAEFLDQSVSNDQFQGLLDMLNERLLLSQRPNKFEEFEKLLFNNGFEVAVGLLRRLDTGQNHEFFKHLAEFYAKDVVGLKSAKKIAGDLVLSALNDFKALSKEDVETVKKAEDQNKDTVMLSILTRKSENWCQQLVMALLQSESFDLLEEILPGFEDFLKQRHKITPKQLGEQIDDIDLKVPASIVDDVVQNFLASNQNPVEDALFNKRGVKDNTKVKLLDEASAKFEVKQEVQEEEQAETEMQMRLYQEELAAPGLKGRNCVVIAPTGSGKTLVSIKIALAKLRSRHGAKVAFLADRTQLVDQQFEAFKKQLPEEFKVTNIRGGSEQRFPLIYNLEEFSVLILSTQILLNNLNDKSDDGLQGDITRFDMLIFDECHHCDKDHPAKKIMEFYFECKEAGKTNLPQIVGLTASPGTGNAYRLEDAVNHVMKICANLDCQELVTVRDSYESLKAHVSDPKAKLHCVGSKEQDKAQKAIESFMNEAESMLFQVSNEAGISVKSPPSAKGTFIYTNFCGELNKMVYEFNEVSSKAVYACWRYLKSCNVAHLIVSLFRATDALKYLKLQLEDFGNNQPTCDVDRRLRNQSQSVFRELETYCNTDQSANSSPALKCLSELLHNQFKEVTDSRVIVFVQQRCFTQAVKDFIDDTMPQLAQMGVKAGVMTGANASGEVGGITQNEQTDILRDFRLGTLKILVSTSVSEEGLDIQKCNMVVRFCHVTNEISMVQSKGRGRAEDSSYHVIVPGELDWLERKEMTNNTRNLLMQRAVNKIGDMNPENFLKQIRELQAEQRDVREIRLVKQRASGDAVRQDSVYRLLCKSCNAFACLSVHLRKADIHYVVVCNEIVVERRFCLVAGKADPDDLLASSIQCGAADCSQKWGSLRKYKGVILPMLTVQSFKFFRAADNRPIRRSIKKWTDAAAYFSVPDVTPSELQERAATLPDSAFASLRLSL